MASPDRQQLSNVFHVCFNNLEGLDKGPEQDADGFSLSEQLDEASGSEEPEEAQVDEVVLRQGVRNQCDFLRPAAHICII